MKNLDLMGVQELDAKEIMETDGGLFGIDDIIIGGLVVGATISLANNFGDFLDGISDGWNAV